MGWKWLPAMADPVFYRGFRPTSPSRSDHASQVARHPSRQTVHMTDWKVVGSTLSEGPFEVGGVNVWAYKWRRAGGSVELPHPKYPLQMHRMDIYEIDIDGRAIRFAAGELSNGVWGFYVPNVSWRANSLRSLLRLLQRRGS